MRHVAPDGRVPHGERRQLRGVLGPQHGLAPRGNGAERFRRRHLLEGPRPDDLRLHLTGQRDRRRAVRLGVPHPGEQVGGSGTRDRQGGGGPARLLPVRGHGEGRGALVPHPHEHQAALGLRPAHGVRHSEVRVPDHAEDRVDTPVGEGADDLVHERGDVFVRGQPHPQAVPAFLDGVGGGAVDEARRRLARDRVVLVTRARVRGRSRARACRRRAARPGGAPAVEDAPAPVRPRHAQRPTAGHDRGHTAVGHVARLDPHPGPGVLGRRPPAPPRAVRPGAGRDPPLRRRGPRRASPPTRRR